MGSASKASIRECTNCGDEIRAYGHRKGLDEIFCSRDCRSDHKNVERECPNCGDTFEILRSEIECGRDNTGTYCSTDCMDEWRSKNWVGENNPLYIDSGVECASCGESFQKRPAKIDAHDKHFCSRACHGVWISKNLTGENHPRWVENRADVSFYDSAKWNETRKEVYKRDGYTCQACGRGNMMLHAHHIDPIPDGPKYEMSNLITLCISCHSKVHNGNLDSGAWKDE